MELARIVLASQVTHHRHAVVFELSVAQQTLVIGVVLHHRPQQEIPVGREGRCPVLADMGKESGLSLVVGGRQHGAVGAEPLGALEAVTAVAVGFPVDRIGAAEPEHGLLGAGERDVAAVKFDGQDDKVEIVEKVEVDMGNVEFARRHRGVGIGAAHAGDVVAAEYPNRRFRRIGAPRLSLAIQEALDVGQKGDELAVMTGLKTGGIIGELVVHLAPRVVRHVLFQDFPVVLDLAVLAQGHELQRP